MKIKDVLYKLERNLGIPGIVLACGLLLFFGFMISCSIQSKVKYVEVASSEIQSKVKYVEVASSDIIKEIFTVKDLKCWGLYFYNSEFLAPSYSLTIQTKSGSRYEFSDRTLKQLSQDLDYIKSSAEGSITVEK